MKLVDKKNIYIFFIITIIILYDHVILNGLEKMCFSTFFDYKLIKRPSLKCEKIENVTLKCLGMPSGHAQSITIFALLLFYYKQISFNTSILLIILVSLQRVFSEAHTVLQVLTGIIVGSLYSYIYISNHLSYKCLFYILGITFILICTIMYKIEIELYKPIPNWVDSSMISSIQKKRTSPFYLKFLYILANSVTQGRTFITWNQLEDYLDILIEKITETNIQFDGVVGIKTGGAIISDYVSKKLNIPNYKIKISREEYHCDKKPVDTFNDIYQRSILGNLGVYSVCEPIKEDIQGKNIILIDEMITTGKTMNEAITYVKNVKHTNVVLPVCISFLKNTFKHDNNYQLIHVLNGVSSVWPWGYDN